MKELLHSRLFRKNLKKWLFMYVGTICLLTSVITYSKYISAFNGSDKARSAKFNVSVTLDETKCSSTNISTVSSICDLGSSRPLPSYDFEFNVDTSELEVSTLLVLTLKSGTGFTLPDKIVEIDANNNEIEVSLVPIANSSDKKFILDINDSNRNQIRHYKATLAYNNKTDLNSVEPVKITALKIDYSAIQVD